MAAHLVFLSEVQREAEFQLVPKQQKLLKKMKHEILASVKESASKRGTL